MISQLTEPADLVTKTINFMNTFLNIQIELCISPISSGQWFYFKSIKDAMILKMNRVPLQYRITARGNNEQYKSKYMANYYGQKRLSKSFSLTVNNLD